MDSTALKLLGLIQEDASQSQKALAKAVECSEPQLSKLMKILRDRLGIVVRAIVPDPSTLGLVTMDLYIHTERPRNTGLERFAQESPFVIECTQLIHATREGAVSKDDKSIIAGAGKGCTYFLRLCAPMSRVVEIRQEIRDLDDAKVVYETLHGRQLKRTTALPLYDISK